MDWGIEICKVSHFSSYVSVSAKPVYGLILSPGGIKKREPREKVREATKGVQFLVAFNLMISDCKKGTSKGLAERREPFI